jgi:hypothetical protein
MTLLLQCEGLDDQARKARFVATSKLSLHGLVRHMAEVERCWFRESPLSSLLRVFPPTYALPSACSPCRAPRGQV